MVSRRSIHCAIAIAVSFFSTARAAILDIEITGSVSSTDLSRGPFKDAVEGDPVSIGFQIDSDFDIGGGGDIHIYETIGYTISVGEVPMTASAVPAFAFSTFSTFHGFEHTSTGLLLPGGGVDHNYRVPIFGAAGPPTFWLPQGSEPQDHIGFHAASLFDVFNQNAVIDQDAGGMGIDQELLIAFDGGISIIPEPATLLLLGAGGLLCTRRRE